MFLWRFNSGGTIITANTVIFSAIATDDHHPLWSCSIHQNAANSKTIRFCYIAQNFNIQHNKSFIVYKMAMGILFTNLNE